MEKGRGRAKPGPSQRFAGQRPALLTWNYAVRMVSVLSPARAAWAAASLAMGTR